MTAQTRLTPSQRRTLAHLRDSHALGMSALSLQQFADLLALRDQGLAVFSGGEPRGCGYCTHCGYGGEPSDSCLHKATRGVWRPTHLHALMGDVWGDAR